MPVIPGVENFGAFLLTAVVLNLTPGADTVYILSRSAAQGRRAGIYSALGIAAGLVGHTLLAAAGLSTVLAQSAVLFDLVRYAGAAYLGFIGLKMLLTRPAAPGPAGLLPAGPARPWRLALDGALTNLLNPKVALFFLALLPQFIALGLTQALLPCLLLGCTFVITGTAWNLMLACLGAVLYARSRHRPQLIERLHKVAGGILIALGLRVALMSRN